MIATLSVNHLLDEASELGQAILQSEPFLAYMTAKKQLREDKEAQRRIQQFSHLKIQYEEVQRFGRYHPNYSEVSAEIRKIKRKVDMIPTVIAFKKAESELESLLNEISGIIAGAVSHTIKVPSGNPFFDQVSCSGGCASGKGCAC